EEVVADDVGAEQVVRCRERRLRLVDVLEELLARRGRRERCRQQADDEEDEENEEGGDSERPTPKTGQGLPQRSEATHTRVHELEPDRGVDVRFQRTPRFRSYETSLPEKRWRRGLEPPTTGTTTRGSTN